MKNTRHWQITTALILALATAGCSSDTAQPAPTPSATAESSPSATNLPLGEGTFPYVSDADRHSADSTAATVVELLYTWDTAVDADRVSAIERAAPLLKQPWKSEAATVMQQIPVAGWDQAAKHQAFSKTELSIKANDTAQDFGPDRAVRAFHVEWTWTGRDGQTTPGGSTEVIVYLERSGTQWSVVGHHDSESAASTDTAGNGGIAADTETSTPDSHVH